MMSRSSPWVRTRLPGTAALSSALHLPLQPSATRPAADPLQISPALTCQPTGEDFSTSFPLQTQGELRSPLAVAASTVICTHLLLLWRHRGLLLTQDKLRDAVQKLEAYKAGGNIPPSGVTDAEMWRARLTHSIMVHPDTGEEIPYVFRMSFFAPANIPIAVGMVMFGQSTGAQLFWQLANQVYNAGVNFANRNATVEVTNTEALTSLAAASSLACGMAFAMGRVAKRVAANPARSPAFKAAVGRLVPLTAVAAAGAFNAMAMRYKEGLNGIDVYDEEGHVYGKSVAAGRMGLLQVAATRVVLPIPILLMPPYIIDALKRLPALQSALLRAPRAVGLPLELSVIVACILVALPGAIALFPQEVSVDPAWLEPEFQNLTQPSTGAPVKTLIYNKGM